MVLYSVKIYPVIFYNAYSHKNAKRSLRQRPYPILKAKALLRNLPAFLSNPGQAVLMRQMYREKHKS